MPCTSMERPERYDPEDIEHLLSERPFHQLLAEEKAYVLRHIADAEEYERMRALLLHLREGEQQHAPVMPDPGDRERVMAAFRERQQPVWRVWLNSIAAFMAQGQEGFVWRPALALAGVALVLVVGVAVVFRSTGEMPQQLAEVAQPKTERTAPVPVATTMEEVGGATMPGAEAAGLPVTDDVQEVNAGSAVHEEKAEGTVGPDRISIPPPITADASEEVAMDAATGMAELELGEDLSAAPASRSEEAYSVVRQQELARNATVGNVTGTVSVREAAARGRSMTVVEDRSRSVADDHELLTLLRSGW